MQTIIDFGTIVEGILNTILGITIIIFAFLFLIKKLEKRLNIDNTLIELSNRAILKIIDIIPSSYAKKLLSQAFDIEAEVFILLPKISLKNYQHLAYQLNGINRFFSENPSCSKHMKIIFINNSSSFTTEDDIENLLSLLYKNRRYIFIATMSDIFDTLLQKIGTKIKSDTYYKNMVKVIGTLASQSKEFSQYKSYENIIRLSPPDFDEAKKASMNIFTKLVSSYCPSKICEFHSANNIIVISNNAYGDAVKNSFINIFHEYQKELDQSTNYYVNAKELDKNINNYYYHFNNGTIQKDKITNKRLDELLKSEGASFNYFFIIAYEPNVSKILQAIDKTIQKSANKDAQYSILISATASVKDWRDRILKSIKELKSLDLIEEINYIHIQYPKFKSVVYYKPSHKKCKLYTLESKNNKVFLQETTIQELNKEYDINSIIQKSEINYINGFMIMSLLLAQKLLSYWDLNLIIEKERLYGNIESKNSIGIKILSSGDSIDHFTIKTLYKKNSS